MAGTNGRPAGVQKTPVALTEKVPLLTANIPRRIVDSHKGNKGIKACCKKEENLRVQAFKTSKDRPAADLIVMVCDKCSCRHFRAGLDSGGGAKRG